MLLAAAIGDGVEPYLGVVDLAAFALLHGSVFPLIGMRAALYTACASPHVGWSYVSRGGRPSRGVALLLVPSLLALGWLCLAWPAARLAGWLGRLEALECLVGGQLIARHDHVGAGPQGRNPGEFRELIAQHARRMRLDLTDDAMWRQRWWRGCRDVHPVGQDNHQQGMKLHLACALFDQGAQPLGHFARQTRFG